MSEVQTCLPFLGKSVCSVALSYILQKKLTNIGTPSAECEENCFVLKAVIGSSDVSPSWMHPTKLYSCFSENTLSRTESGITGMKQTDTFLQILSLVSGKSLSMVHESCPGRG